MWVSHARGIVIVRMMLVAGWLTVIVMSRFAVRVERFFWDGDTGIALTGRREQSVILTVSAVETVSKLKENVTTKN
jgi:hypothetical protein